MHEPVHEALHAKHRHIRVAVPKIENLKPGRGPVDIARKDIRCCAIHRHRAGIGARHPGAEHGVRHQVVVAHGVAIHGHFHGRGPAKIGRDLRVIRHQVDDAHPVDEVGRQTARPGVNRAVRIGYVHGGGVGAGELKCGEEHPR